MVTWAKDAVGISMNNKTVTCLKCGWVAFQVSRESAIREFTSFNEYYDTLTPKEQEDYYGSKKSSIRFYEHCMFCDGSYQNFRDSQEGDCPDGCTLNPIIDREE